MLAPKRLAAYLDLNQARVLVAGGGAVAAQKLRALPRGPEVRVVSPALGAACRQAMKRHKAQWLRRPARASDAAWADLIFAASNSRQSNHALAKAAQKARRLCCVVDEPGQGNIVLPAVARVGNIEVSISSGGRSPAMSKALRIWLEAKLKKPALQKALRYLGRSRQRLKADPQAKVRALKLFRNARAFARLLQ